MAAGHFRAALALHTMKYQKYQKYHDTNRIRRLL